MDFVSLLRAFYLFPSAIILIIYAIAPFRDRFLAYGPRTFEADSPHLTKSSGFKGKLPQALDVVTEIKVPHSWFISFYLTSTISSLVWFHQLTTQGPLYRIILAWTPERQNSMTVGQVVVCWLLVAIQGSRRLYECIAFTKPSRSTMWVVHWILGNLFYIATGIAIWVEGARAIELVSSSIPQLLLTGIPLRAFLLVPVFFAASGAQHEIHAYLASLEKYTLPKHAFFNRISCPHYTAEAVLYLALAFLAAPQSSFINLTMMSVTVFVVVNLGVTADMSRKWSAKKFGEQCVTGKWRMIPGLW